MQTIIEVLTMLPSSEPKPGLPNTPEGRDFIQLTILEEQAKRLNKSIESTGRYLDIVIAATGLHRVLFASPKSFRDEN